MFRRVLLDNWMYIFPLVSFCVAATVYLVVTYKSLRLSKPQIQHFAHLPFNEHPATSHDAEA